MNGPCCSPAMATVSVQGGGAPRKWTGTPTGQACRLCYRSAPQPWHPTALAPLSPGTPEPSPGTPQPWHPAALAPHSPVTPQPCHPTALSSSSVLCAVCVCIPGGLFVRARGYLHVQYCLLCMPRVARSSLATYMSTVSRRSSDTLTVPSSLTIIKSKQRENPSHSLTTGMKK